jgi:hypothetical protein
VTAAFSHLVVDFLGVPAAQLRDAALIGLLDVLHPAAQAAGKALDVFARRLTSREIRSDQRARG